MRRNMSGPDEQEEIGLAQSMLGDWPLIIVSNRGPVNFTIDETGELQTSRSGGGLVTALLGLAQHVDITWIASALTDLEKEWKPEPLTFDDSCCAIDLRLVPIEKEVYEGYYNVISNPLLWFLQHSIWDLVSGPNITRATWQAWHRGYEETNRLFASEVARQIRALNRPALVMMQDYHLYLAPRQLRSMLRRKTRYFLTHFIHIPWPGAEDWGILPPGMRQAILEGLTAVDLLGFQTREDGLNFIRTVESFLPRAHVSFKGGRIWYRNHATYVRDFPISIDVPALLRLAETEEVAQYRAQFEEDTRGMQVIVRVDRTEPSKNIVRGFQAFGDMLAHHPEMRGKVKFIALLVPSRLEVDEYKDYHAEMSAAAAWVNSTYGASEWEPVRVILSENYPRAIAALQLYDVLLVNSLADGMNLVAKEGPLVNRRDGVLVLSERTGARQQLEGGALVISPCDVYATSEALYRALTLPAEARRANAAHLRKVIEESDINDWFESQLRAIADIIRKNREPETGGEPITAS